MIFWNEKVTFICILATTNNTIFIRKCCYKQFTSWTASPMQTTVVNQLPCYALYFQQPCSKEIKLSLFINSIIYYKQFVIYTLHLIFLKVTKLKSPARGLDHKLFHNNVVNWSSFVSNYNRGSKTHGPEGCNSFLVFWKFKIQIPACRSAILSGFLWFSQVPIGIFCVYTPNKPITISFHIP
jgi:hypothetical protein